MDGMGIGMLGILKSGKEDMNDFPQIKGPMEKGIDGVGVMVLREGNVEIFGMPPIPHMDEIDGLATLYEARGPNIM
jgi:hypothetical protein